MVLPVRRATGPVTAACRATGHVIAASRTTGPVTACKPTDTTATCQASCPDARTHDAHS